MIYIDATDPYDSWFGCSGYFSLTEPVEIIKFLWKFKDWKLKVKWVNNKE